MDNVWTEQSFPPPFHLTSVFVSVFSVVCKPGLVPKIGAMITMLLLCDVDGAPGHRDSGYVSQHSLGSPADVIEWRCFGLLFCLCAQRLPERSRVRVWRLLSPSVMFVGAVVWVGALSKRNQFHDPLDHHHPHPRLHTYPYSLILRLLFLIFDPSFLVLDPYPCLVLVLVRVLCLLFLSFIRHSSLLTFLVSQLTHTDNHTPSQKQGIHECDIHGTRD